MIVDAPATGHGVGLLQTPQTFADIARVGPMAHQAATINADPHRPRGETGVVIVALPEEMPVNESATLEPSSSTRSAIAVDRIFMNGLYPERFDAERESVAAAAAGADAAPAAAGDRGGARREPRARPPSASSSTRLAS